MGWWFCVYEFFLPSVIFNFLYTPPDNVEGMHGSEMNPHSKWQNDITCSCHHMRVGLTMYKQEQSLKIGKAKGIIIMTVTFEHGSLKTFNKWDVLSLNRGRRKVLEGPQLNVPPQIIRTSKSFIEWVDEIWNIGVLANPNTAVDVKTVRKNGTKQSGLCYTKHVAQR